VSNNTGVNATTDNKIFVGGAGSVDVQKGGKLAIDDQKSVSNYVVNSTAVDSVLTKRVSFAGGSQLVIEKEVFATVDEIGTILRYLSVGTSVSASVSRAVGVPTGESVFSLGTDQNFKPSQIVGINGMSKDRVLEIKAKQKEDATNLAIPPGAWIEAVEPVTSVQTLEVSGGFRVPAGSFNDLTSVTVAGALDAAGNAFPKLASLTVSGELYAPEATGDTAGIVINVGSGGSVQLGTIAKLNAGCTVAARGSLNAVLPASSAGMLTTEPGARINGVETTGGGYEIIDTIGTLEAGKTYELKAKTGDGGTTIPMSSATTLPAGATLVIPEGITLAVSTINFTVNGTVKAAGTVTVAQGGAIIGTGTIEATGTVAGMPKFPTAQLNSGNANPTGVYISSSTKNLSTGRIEIRLSGTVAGGFPNNIVNGLWGNPGNNIPDGNWSWVVITNILPDPVAGTMVIKHTNQSLSYYKGTNHDFVTTTPLTEASPEEDPDVYISANNTEVYKWKKYLMTGTDTISGQPADTTDNGFGILLWSAASSKTATLDITPVPGKGTPYTVTVDWSGLRITPAPVE
jgi:hypothetical protein